MGLSRKNIILIAVGLLIVIVGGGAVAIIGAKTPEEKAASFLEKGRTYYENGEFVKADLELRNALQLNDRLTDAWFMLSRMAEKKSEWQKAFRLSTKTVELDPANVEARLTMGKLFLAGRQLDKALDQSDELLKLNSRHAGVRAFRASVLLRLSNLDGALAEIKLAQEIDPNNLDAFITLAALRRGQGNIDEAISIIDRGLKAHPDNPLLHVFKIGTLESQKAYEPTIAAYQAAIGSKAEKDTFFQRGLVNLHARNKKFELVLTEFEKILNAKPKDTDLKLRYAGILAGIRGGKAAEQALTEFGKAELGNLKLKLGLAAVYSRTGKVDEARSLYNRVIGIKDAGPDGLEAKVSLAVLEVSQGNQAKAETLLAEVIASEPRNGPALLLRASLRLRQVRTDEAIADVRSVLRDSPDHPSGLQLLARAHRQAGSNSLASDRYLQAVGKNPRRMDIRLEYARFLMDRKDFARAEEALLEILAIQPKSRPALRALTRLQIRQKDYASAEEYRRRASDAGDAAFSKAVLGSIYNLQDKLDLSIEAFKRSFELAPNAPEPLVAVVRGYLRDKRYKEARNFLNSVINAHEGNVMAYTLLGQVAILEGRPAEAEAKFREGIENSPTSPVNYTNLANLKSSQKQFAEAEKVLGEGLAALPEDTVLRLNLASLMERRARFDEAIQLYQKIIDDNPRINIAVNNLASLLSEHRNDAASFDRALKLAERFRNSTFPHFLDTLGWIYYRRGNFKRAVEYHEKSVKGAPNLPLFRYHLGMAYLGADNRAGAKRELEKAVGLGAKKFPELAKVKAALGNL